MMSKGVIGQFITLEGGEGCGKSTQVRALADRLIGLNYDVVITREPGGTDNAEIIRELLLKGGDNRWNSRAEALLFAAARADHIHHFIKPALKRGQWVICDRFIDSSRAYQSGGSGLNDDSILKLHEIGSEGFMPSRTIILDLDEDIANERVTSRDGDSRDRIGGRDKQFHQKVRQAFRSYAMQDPDRITLISANASIDKITADIMESLSDLIAL